MPTSVRRVLLFAPPALFSIVNYRHPILTAPIYCSVSPHLSWWSTLHLLNLGLFALLGLAVYLLLGGVHNAAANLSRVALAVFAPLHCAFDALAGLGTGLLAHLASQLARRDRGRGHLPRRRMARAHLFTGAGGMSATPARWLTTLASGLVMLVIAKPGVVTALLTLAALLFGAAHVPPTGPLGALCFLAAAVLLELDLARPLASRCSEGHPSRREAPA